MVLTLCAQAHLGPERRSFYAIQLLHGQGLFVVLLLGLHLGLGKDLKMGIEESPRRMQRTRIRM